MSLDLKAIRTALAAQLTANIDRATNVYAYEVDSPAYPYVIVKPAAGDYVGYFGSFGPNGVADVMFELEIATIAGDPISMGIAMDAYLSSGSTFGSSVVDAVHTDRTLGGTVADCVALTARVEPLGDFPLIATVPVMVRVNKSGATV